MGKKQVLSRILVFSLLLLGLFGLWSKSEHWIDLWQTSEQQAEQLMRAGKYQAAAEHSADPLRRGNALFRGKNFAAALEVYTTINSAEGRFNLGNTLVLLGRYTEAIVAYREALTIKPGWPPAKNNLLIARLRAEQLKTSGGEMTGGQLDADEIVFEEGGSDKESQQIEIAGATDEVLTNEQLRALWLRKVQTQPADFLRLKFSYQYAMQSRGNDD